MSHQSLHFLLHKHSVGDSADDRLKAWETKIFNQVIHPKFYSLAAISGNTDKQNWSWKKCKT